MQPPRSFGASLFLVLLNLIFLSSALPNPNPLPVYSTHIQIQSSTLSPRDWRDPAYHNIFNHVVVLGGGWALHYNTLDFIRPNVPTGAESLLQFYDLILASLDAEWEHRQQVYASTPGGISLALYSAETLITKEWLRPFINALKKRVVVTHNAGSTMAGFKMTAVSAVSGVAVVFALALPSAGAAAAA
ncbi:MAG: hypothetical protein L6R38_003727 [Xanthoria sp. 2 TBL-2021]|nr:MAG: hypothetical protein L6R38_003727 [Xanthoria sp. 2 TBL-2021]